MSTPHAVAGTFNRIVLKNSTSAIVTVTIRINNYGMFYYSNSGGGGGVASHVKIDGTATVAGTVDVGKMPDVKVTFPTTMPVTGTVEVSKMPDVKVAFPTTDLPVKGNVGLVDGTKLEVSKMPDVKVTFPTTMPVTGTVAVSTMPKVDVAFPSTMPVTGTAEVATMTADPNIVL